MHLPSVSRIKFKFPFKFQSKCEFSFLKYRYCGPGTELCKRLKWNIPGINPLDDACREHDIAYGQSRLRWERTEADEILARKAWIRFFSLDASAEERAAAFAVATIMETMIHAVRPAIGSLRSYFRWSEFKKKKKKNCSMLMKTIKIHFCR